MTTRSSRLRMLCTGAFVLYLLVPAPGQAQFTEPPRPAAYALQNVTLVLSDGTHSEGITVVVRGDFIEAIGPNAAIPPDARVLDGDTLYVYPGLVDAHGTVRHELPRDSIDRRVVNSWNPTREAQGFRPHRRVADYITADGASAAAQRKDGVVAVALHPTTGLMPGQSALVLLRPHAMGPAELVVDPALGPVFTLRGGRGFYPSTVMGTFAFYRQTFLDAERHNRIAQAARSDARGIGLPSFDRDYAALRDITGGSTPVWFVANSAEEILQALRLAEELDFRPVIVGGGEAWRHADELARRNVAVLASLDFTKPDQWDAAGKDSASTEPGVLHERRRIEDEYRNAGRLAAAGVRLALVSNGGAADLREGARKAIQYGLSEADAIRALTATPAALLGAPSLARIEPGMPANLVVSDGPLFADDTKVRYTFVSGDLEHGASASARAAVAAGDSADAAQVAGTWSVEVEVEGGNQPSTLTLTQEGTLLSGSMESEMGTTDVSGSVAGNTIEFDITLQIGGQSMTIEFTGTVDEDTMRGEASMPMGSFSWSARRTAPGMEDVR